jgi:hypothetical protein
MARPLKVRIFRDEKKSPNWYVEWRDLEGRKHCESCGPERSDADKRADEITAELRQARRKIKTVAELPPLGASSAAGSQPDQPLLQLRAVLRCPQLDLPVDLVLHLDTELVKGIRRMLSETTQPGGQ